jgi:hypothetical protein
VQDDEDSPEWSELKELLRAHMTELEALPMPERLRTLAVRLEAEFTARAAGADEPAAE